MVTIQQAADHTLHFLTHRALTVPNMIAARLVAPLAEPSAPSAVPPPLLPPVQRGLARRHVVLGLPSLAGLATAASVAAPHAAYAAASPLSSAAGGQLSVGGELPADSLAARLVTTGQLKQPGNQPPWPWIPKQTYYPKWMFGEWQVTAEGAVDCPVAQVDDEPVQVPTPLPVRTALLRIVLSCALLACLSWFPSLHNAFLPSCCRCRLTWNSPDCGCP